MPIRAPKIKIPDTIGASIAKFSKIPLIPDGFYDPFASVDQLPRDQKNPV